MNYFLVLSLSTIISFFGVIFAKNIAYRFNIGSLPSPRKLHKGFKPVLGGLGFLPAMFFAFLVACLLGIVHYELIIQYRYFWIGLCVIVLTGLLDDVKGIPSYIKIIGQSISAILLVAGGCKIQSLSGPMGEVLNLGVFAIPFTFFWIISIINAINLMDGLDGLAGGVSLIIITGLVIISLNISNIFLVILCLGIAGGILGFLRFNYHPASIFMGEVGSLQLGYVLAFLSIETLKVAASHHVYLLASLVIFGVPLTDTLISFLRRLGQGTSPFVADTQHIHHRLLNLGLMHLQTVWLIYIFSTFFVGLGVLMVFFKGFVGLILFIIAVLFALLWIYRLGYIETRLSWQNLSNQFQKTGGIQPRAPLYFNRIWHILILLISDFIAISIALYLIYWVKFQSGLFPEIVYRPASEYFFTPVFILLVLGWIALFYLNNLYHMDWDMSRFQKSMRVSKIITFGVLVLALITADYQQLVNRSQLLSILSYWIIMSICVIGARLLIIKLQKRLNIFEYSQRNTLIVGCNEVGVKVLKDIQYNPHLIFNVKGFVSKRIQNKTFQSKPVLGTYKHLPELIHKYRIEEIIIALPETNTNDFIQILSLCEPLNVKIKIPPGMYEIISGRRSNLISHGYVQIFAENMVLWQWLIKRIFDIIISLIIIIVISPLLLFIGLFIFFKFRRTILIKIPILGKYGIPFNMYVFRLGAENYSYDKNPIYLGIEDKLQNWNKFLHFLYRYRIYKFPQLFNVLIGDMSIVGPRSEPVEWYQETSKTIRLLHRRISIRPGLTGLAQVKYHFELSHKVLQEWVKYDIYYIENISLSMDLGIFLRTILLLLLRPYSGVSEMVKLKEKK